MIFFRSVTRKNFALQRFILLLNSTKVISKRHLNGSDGEWKFFMALWALKRIKLKTHLMNDGDAIGPLINLFLSAVEFFPPTVFSFIHDLLITQRLFTIVNNYAH